MTLMTGFMVQGHIYMHIWEKKTCWQPTFENLERKKKKLLTFENDDHWHCILLNTKVFCVLFVNEEFVDTSVFLDLWSNLIYNNYF